MRQPDTEPRIIPMGKWRVHEWAEALSTNDLARSLASWSIARCDVQTAGRGRFNRPWIGAQGGLWASFTVPLDPDNTVINWGHLPLVAGLAVLDLLNEYGISQARLRWPNDLLIGQAKLAGILVERPAPDMAVIGIGINISNSLGDLVGLVKDEPASLAQHLSPAPSVHEVMERLAGKIEQRFTAFSSTGLPGIMGDMQSAWKEEKEVTIQTDDGDTVGIFTGIDEAGNPVLRLKNGERKAIPSHIVNRLVEN